MTIVDFETGLIGTEAGLTLTDDAIAYALSITNNQLIDTSLQSPLRFLTEAMVYAYGQIIEELQLKESEILEALFKVLNFQLNDPSYASVNLRFSLLATYDQALFVPKAFPVSSTTGILFLTNEILVIPAGSKVGYVMATSTRSGKLEGTGKNTVNLPRQLLQYPVIVTNESDIVNGIDQDTIEAAQSRLALMLSTSKTITARDYEARLEEFDSRFFANVNTGDNIGELQIAIGKRDGSGTSDRELITIQNFFNSVRYIGIKSIAASRCIITQLFVEIVLKVYNIDDFQADADTMSLALQNYFLPGGDAQMIRKGIIILEDVKRSINTFPFDYLQTLRIGTNEINAVGNNYVFNENTERCRLRILRLTLIDDTTRTIKNYEFN